MRFGMRPDGQHYYPAFPYTSFTRIADSDLRDLWAYLRTLAPSEQRNRAHALRFPFAWRWLITVWKWFFFSPGAYVANPARDPTLNRGAYLSIALAHCGECHTPRNFLGALRRNKELSGGSLPEGQAPNLTPTRLKRWSDIQLQQFLRTGLTPEGDATSDVMYEVVRNSTSQLSDPDIRALIAYLRSLTSLPDGTK